LLASDKSGKIERSVGSVSAVPEFLKLTIRGAAMALILLPYYAIAFVPSSLNALADNPAESTSAGGAASSSGGEPPTIRLSGGVSHSDRLEPLPSDERVGAVVTFPQPKLQMQPQQLPAQPRPQFQSQPNFTAPQLLPRPQLQPQTHLPPQKLSPTLQMRPPVPPPSQRRPYAQSPQQSQLSSQQHGTGQPLPPHSAGAQYSSISTSSPAIPPSSQGSLKMLQQLNAHVSTAGSPLAPRPQILAPNQRPIVRQQAQGMTIQLQSQSAHMDSMSIYKRNLQAIAAMDLQHNGGAVLKAGLQAQGPSVKVEIPFWLAGEWQRTETSESSRIQLPSGKALKAVGKQAAVVTDIFGTYKDKDGKIWMVVPLHNRGQVDRGFAIDRHQVNKYELILTGKTSALVKVVASHSVIDKATHKVIQAYQDEELNAYSLVQDGLVKTDSSVKVFDQMGNAKLLTRAVSLEKRISKL